jgi:hypothetical protein
LIASLPLPPCVSGPPTFCIKEVKLEIFEFGGQTFQNGLSKIAELEGKSRVVCKIRKSIMIVVEGDGRHGALSSHSPRRSTSCIGVHSGAARNMIYWLSG